MRYQLLIVLFLSGCQKDPCARYIYDWGFNYDVEPNTKTPDLGIPVDTSGQDLDPRILSKIDELTRETVECLRGKPVCYWESRSLDCLEVKIPNDWFYSKKDPRQQLVNVRVPDRYCSLKDFNPPCYWRAGIQDGYKVVTTPNLYLYKDPLIKYITGCEDVWYSELSECANPGFEPDWLEKE